MAKCVYVGSIEASDEYNMATSLERLGGNQFACCSPRASHTFSRVGGSRAKQSTPSGMSGLLVATRERVRASDGWQQLASFCPRPIELLPLPLLPLLLAHRWLQISTGTAREEVHLNVFLRRQNKRHRRSGDERLHFAMLSLLIDKLGSRYRRAGGALGKGICQS